MKQPPLQTEEDLQLVKDMILLTILLDVLERDIQTFMTVPLKMGAIYIKTLECIQDKVIADLAATRAQLKLQGMRIYEQQRTPLGVEAQYLCRGYHHHFSMLWGLVKSEVKVRLSAYMNIDLGAIS
jgi:hypothetical protein